MKTTKQLKKYYIYLLLNTLSDKDRLKEIERTKYIISTIDRKRTKQEKKYINFIENNIYKNNTTKALIEKDLKITIKKEKDILIYFKNDFKKANNYFQKKSKEASRAIISYFEKYIITLNKLYREI